jgi:transposase-like protein
VEEGTDEDPKAALVKLGIQRVIEEALEAAVRETVGRDSYARRPAGAQGYRNGTRPGRLATREGEVRYAVPQVRDVPPEALRALRRRLKGRTPELERLGLELFARGCSTRDIEALFTDADGRPLLSRTAVSEITEALWAEYEAFATRELSDVAPLYLFLDGLAERLRPGATREAVLVAWVITDEGKKLLLHVAPGTKESADCCRDFLEDLKRRGFSDPVLVVTDGAPGLIRAVEECFPASLRQRCLAHRMRNLMAKLPEEVRAEFQLAARAAYQAPSLALARAAREEVVARFHKDHPTAVACFEDDFEACIAQLHCPPRHRRICRTTNLLERLFLEERRRLDAAGTLFGERAVLKLMAAALMRGAERWRGVTITEFEQRQLAQLRAQLQEAHAKRHAPVTKTARRDVREKRPPQLPQNTRSGSGAMESSGSFTGSGRSNKVRLQPTRSGILDPISSNRRT